MISILFLQTDDAYVWTLDSVYLVFYLHTFTLLLNGLSTLFTSPLHSSMMERNLIARVEVRGYASGH
ncbi:hypothetical protein Bcell_2958 [Evansella cellulosilytica DSM 2522]|uniref:Uncharacterized protein n=1 Tax=Evansella cellulosilytica (strain ATCC 21833 / DSM 2522 / FERM P-1141 / JCM 9156 / N-4) TaxID=649639 RepID=E6TXZ6_EVAC2|nr:hypothetical protein Bcell_2958 [Evansella cellulosilytica DSM 2522]